MDLIDETIVQAASSPAATSLRVCCYGSSSSKTPDIYLQEARHLGYLLAKRGHICVNGAGSFGCMAALNQGADLGDGHIVGVIHEMFIVDGSDAASITRDGGAHSVFDNSKQTTTDSTKKGPIREMLIAGGSDLQERKRLLVEGAHALAVLPGGPGTWDELWEMACARNVQLTNIPIVVVNVNGYYDPFKKMLQRAYKDELIRWEPDHLVHFCDTAVEAMLWIEQQGTKGEYKPKITKRTSSLRGSSFMDSPKALLQWFHRLTSTQSLDDVEEEEASFEELVDKWLLPFGSGLAMGIIMSVLWKKRA